MFIRFQINKYYVCWYVVLKDNTKRDQFQAMWFTVYYALLFCHAMFVLFIYIYIYIYIYYSIIYNLIRRNVEEEKNTEKGKIRRQYLTVQLFGNFCCQGLWPEYCNILLYPSQLLSDAALYHHIYDKYFKKESITPAQKSLGAYSQEILRHMFYSFLSLLKLMLYNEIEVWLNI